MVWFHLLIFCRPHLLGLKLVVVVICCNSQLQQRCLKGLIGLYYTDDSALEEEVERKAGWLLKAIFIITAFGVASQFFPYMGINILNPWILFHLDESIDWFEYLKTFFSCFHCNVHYLTPLQSTQVIICCNNQFLCCMLRIHYLREWGLQGCVVLQ